MQCVFRWVVLASAGCVQEGGISHCQSSRHRCCQEDSELSCYCLGESSSDLFVNLVVSKKWLMALFC